MKKLLFFAMIFSFTATLSAQSLPTAKRLKKSAKETVVVAAPTKSDYIKKALLNDEELQTAAIDHLKSNPESTQEIATIATNNKGGLQGMIQSILGDKKLSTMAIDYIANNPKLLEKAMKIVGM